MTGQTESISPTCRGPPKHQRVRRALAVESWVFKGELVRSRPERHPNPTNRLSSSHSAGCARRVSRTYSTGHPTAAASRSTGTGAPSPSKRHMCGNNSYPLICRIVAAVWRTACSSDSARAAVETFASLPPPRRGSVGSTPRLGRGIRSPRCGRVKGRMPRAAQSLPGRNEPVRVARIGGLARRGGEP